MPNGSDLRVTTPSNSIGSKLLTFLKPARCWIYMDPIGRLSWDHSCLLRLSIRLSTAKIIITISVLSVKLLGVPWNTSCGIALRTGFITPFLSTHFNFGSDGASLALPIIIMRLSLTWLSPFKTSGVSDMPMEDLIFLPNYSCGIVLFMLGHAPCPIA